jgi:hypothetical protein
MANLFTRAANKVKKNAGRVATGIATAGASELVGYDRLKDLAFGQDPSEVPLPPELQAAQDRRRALADEIMGRAQPGARTEATTAARAAAAEAGRGARADLRNQVMSVAAGARGVGSVRAQRQAMNAASLGGARIANQVAETTANAAAAAAGQDVAASQRDAQQRLAELGMVADLTQSEEAAALAADEYRKQNARKGLAGVVLSTAGGLLGQKYGGAAGGKAGAELGYGIGEMFNR